MRCAREAMKFTVADKAVADDSCQPRRVRPNFVAVHASAHYLAVLVRDPRASNLSVHAARRSLARPQLSPELRKEQQ